ncbi:MAG: SulP family inorganic anion transporter [Xenococcaceae cyanobacterium]
MTQQVTSQLSIKYLKSSLLENVHPSQLLSSLTAGTIVGVIGVIRAISYAALIFSGMLSEHLSTGIGMAVFSTGIISIAVALTSAFPGMIATPLAAPTAILAILAAAIANGMAGSATSEEILITVLVAIVLSSLLTGLFLLALGLLKLGDKIRFIPYPVVGGFMAGTGWLLVDGFIQITTDVHLNFSNLSHLCQTDVILQWLPGLIFAIVLLIVSHLFKHYLVMPGTLLGFAGLFYLFLWVTHTPIAEARAAGWLLGPFPEGGLWHPLNFSALPQVSWLAILNQVGSIFTVMFISLLSLLLSNSGIELVVGRDINLNSELQAVGIANLASGFSSGMAGNQALPSTLLVHDIGAEKRLTGVLSAVPCIAVLLLGSSFLSFLPKSVLGSLILYLGLSLLIQWVYEAWFKLPLIDYLTVLVILVAINTLSFLQGIIVGFAIAVVLFMYNYSSVDVAKNTLSGATTRSNVGRTPSQHQLLSKKGEQIYILKLQGFLFFGTANYLLNKVRNRAMASEEMGADDQSLQPLRYVVLDFRQVSDLDSSAVLTFNKILKIARKRGLTLIFTNLSSEFQEKLAKNGGFEKDSSLCQIFPDIDRGLEWCENQILNQEPDCSTLEKKLSEQLAQMFLKPEQVPEFINYLEPQQVPEGHVIFQQGKPHIGLYFIESGQVSVLLELSDGRTKRLQTCTSGNVLGEMRFYGKVPLSTSVVTDTPSSLYYLSPQAFEKMKTEASELVQAVQEFIVGVLCDSLVRREEQLRVMQ